MVEQKDFEMNIDKEMDLDLGIDKDENSDNSVVGDEEMNPSDLNADSDLNEKAEETNETLEETTEKVVKKEEEDEEEEEVFEQLESIGEERFDDGLMYEHYRIEIDPKQTPLRIDKFLFKRLKKTRSKIQAAAKANGLLVNDKPVKANYKVRPGEVVKIVLPKPVRTYEIYPEKMDLNIVFEDDYFLILNKEPGVVVHPGVGNYTGTLVHGLAYHFGNREVITSDNEDAIRPGIVHRIDKDTSGLMVIAKDEDALSKLGKQFFDHTVERRYYALVWGDLEEDRGTIVGHVGRHPRLRQSYTVFPEGETGKHAVTHYKVVQRFGYVTLVECKLETGRTHQIRVHFQHIGHPLFNDAKYGGDKIVKGTVFSKYRQFVENGFKIIQRQSLHAKTLGFEHPITGENVHFDSELPADMKGIIEKWSSYVNR